MSDDATTSGPGRVLEVEERSCPAYHAALNKALRCMIDQSSDPGICPREAAHVAWAMRVVMDFQKFFAPLDQVTLDRMIPDGTPPQ